MNTRIERTRRDGLNRIELARLCAQATSVALLVRIMAGCGHDEPINGVGIDDGRGGSGSGDAGAPTSSAPRLRAANGGDSGSGATGTGGGAGTADAGWDVNADADDREDGGDDGPDGAVTVDARPDGPPVCGDGWREPLIEECDDGPGSVADSCDETCRVRDVLVGPNIAPDGPLRPPGRVLGQGRHPVAAGPSGSAVAFIESEPEWAVKLRTFDARGVPAASAIDVSSGSTVSDSSGPVMGALPSGGYAVAWSDLNGDGDLRGIAFTIVDPARPDEVPSLTFVNEQRHSSQRNPDLIVTDSDIVVAWVDDADVSSAPDLRFRRLSHAGTPVAAGDETLSATDDPEGGVVLTRFGASWAAAWRAGSAGGETIFAKAGNVSWSVGLFPQGGGPEDLPALVEIDATHLLLVFVETVFGTTGGLATTRLRWAVLDTAAPGPTQWAPLAPLVEPYSLDASVAQDHPSAARTGDALYVAWRSDRVIGDGRADEVWLKPIDIQPAAAGVTLDFGAAEIPLPREDGHSAGDQRLPALAGGAVPGSDALFSAWDDYGRSFGSGQGGPDVVASLLPAPITRLSPRRLER